MKQLLLICAVVALVGGCASTPKVGPIVEKAIRKELKKPTGKLTKAQITELQKALPNCRNIFSNPTK